jgi:hypothetical protein
MKRRTLTELMALPPPKVPSVTSGSKCPLCRARDGRSAMLEKAPSLEDILFFGVVTGILIGKTEAIDDRWCPDCREYLDRMFEMADAVRPS